MRVRALEVLSEAAKLARAAVVDLHVLVRSELHLESIAESLRELVVLKRQWLRLEERSRSVVCMACLPEGGAKDDKGQNIYPQYLVCVEAKCPRCGAASPYERLPPVADPQVHP